jgi:hypothetical protein
MLELLSVLVLLAVGQGLLVLLLLRQSLILGLGLPLAQFRRASLLLWLLALV